ncbi:potassium transporter TrkG [uncultured Shimia sp.]|uniref:potassium transporter TrkG n=1 Tax=uncultured Shimia sp. TaxID=573152 RepID=UPI00261B9C51|nr:potassium transporter TrkG [uncultured Shimia sp.]
MAMLVPAVYAGVLHESHEGRAFLYSAILVLFFFGLIALAISDTGRAPRTVDFLISLFLAFAVLPLVLALPFWWGLATTTYLNAYVEMLSSFTTTGATLFDTPGRLSPPLQLWRGLVGWLGGLLMWIAAAAVFAPLSLGGFEVTTRADPGIDESTQAHVGAAHPMKRWQRGCVALVPIYTGLTAMVWIMLMVLGEEGLTGLMHAMSVMATSGISPVGGLENAKAGAGGEVVLFLFMLFALSRTTFSADTGAVRRESVLKDHEFRLGLVIVVAVPTFLFLRHWVGAYEIDDLQDATSFVRAAWGSVFTVLSFLSTTGFASAEWQAAQNWSGLNTPGLILMGLAIVGGGVATTAGGVKLLRVYVLYLQGLGEIQRLVHPSMVVGQSKASRRIRQKGAQIAWVFFMLFALSLAFVTIALAGFGASFEDALVMAIASLTNTGPLVEVAAETPIDLVSQSSGLKLVLCAAMVLGRLETLAIIALMSTDLWNR